MEPDTAAPGEGHSYFIPMVDMLAGVVFILVILLAAATLVSRDEFVKSESSQAASARADADLQAAEKAEAEAQRALTLARQERAEAERLRLDPRRQVEIAVRTLLERLSAELTREGYQVEASVPEARLGIFAPEAFAGGGSALSTKGQQLAGDVAALLGQELPCLTGRAGGLAQCAAYPPLRLETAEIQAGAPAASGRVPDAALAEARSLVVMSAIAGGRPELMALRSPSGTGVFAYAGDAKPGAAAGSVALRFQIALPKAGKD